MAAKAGAVASTPTPTTTPTTPSTWRPGRTLVWLAYLASWAVYAYVRATKSLDLGAYSWWVERRREERGRKREKKRKRQLCFSTSTLSFSSSPLPHLSLSLSFPLFLTRCQTQKKKKKNSLTPKVRPPRLRDRDARGPLRRHLRLLRLPPPPAPGLAPLARGRGRPGAAALCAPRAHPVLHRAARDRRGDRLGRARRGAAELGEEQGRRQDQKDRVAPRRRQRPRQGGLGRRARQVGGRRRRRGLRLCQVRLQPPQGRARAQRQGLQPQPRPRDDLPRRERDRAQRPRRGLRRRPGRRRRLLGEDASAARPAPAVSCCCPGLLLLLLRGRRRAGAVSAEVWERRPGVRRLQPR